MTAKRTTPADQVAPSPEPLFKPFCWEEHGDPREVLPARLALDSLSRSRDVAAGVAVVLEMLERDTLELDEATPQPLLSKLQQGALIRLCITSCRALEERADEDFEDIRRLREQRRKGGRS